MSELFIDEFMAEVSSVKDVIECVSANFSDFKQYLLESAERGIGFVVKVGHQTIDKEELLSGKFDNKVKSFTLTPVPIGSGGGLGQFFLGIAFIGLGLLTGGAGFLGISSTSLYLIGGAMILKGVTSLFGGNKNGPIASDKDNKGSLIFNGGAQTVTEGSRIPVCYGRHRVGLFVISSRVYSYLVGAVTSIPVTSTPTPTTPPVSSPAYPVVTDDNTCSNPPPRFYSPNSDPPVVSNNNGYTFYPTDDGGGWYSYSCFVWRE